MRIFDFNLNTLEQSETISPTDIDVSCDGGASFHLLGSYCFKHENPWRGCLIGAVALLAVLAREPLVFAIHSEWADEASFELHATLPHTVRFLAAAETLLTHPEWPLTCLRVFG